MSARALRSAPAFVAKAATAALLVTLPAPARAQVTPSAPSSPPASAPASAPPDTAAPRPAPPPQPWCIRGRPLPRCASFFLFELAAHPIQAGSERDRVYAPGATYRRPDFETQLGWTLGAMRNRGPRTALGGAAVTAFSQSGTTLGVVGRWRRWTSANTSLELAAGPARVRVPRDFADGAHGGDQHVWAAGLLGEARANAGDVAAVSTRLIVVPSANRRTRTALGVGGALGSRAAVVGTVGLVAAVTFLYFALAGAYT